MRALSLAQLGNEGALVGDGIPRTSCLEAEPYGVKPEAESGENEGQTKPGDEMPPPLKIGHDGTVVPIGAEHAPCDTVREIGEAAQDENVGAGTSMPEQFFSGGEKRGEFRGHREVGQD